MLSSLCPERVAATAGCMSNTMRKRARRLSSDMGGPMRAWLGGAHHGAFLKEGIRVRCEG